LKKGGWEHLCLPAIAPESTYIRCGGFSYTREAGEALHAAREDVALLEATKHAMGSGNFAAQYQQRPQMESGAIVRPEWFAHRATAPAGGMRVQSWDTGIKAGAHHDASACVSMVEHEGRHYVAHVRTLRLEYPELKRAIVAAAEAYFPDAILIEDKASGQSLIQDLRRETSLPVIACSASEDKVTRLVRVTPMMEAGQVLLPEDAAWLAHFEEELFAFPTASHDDQVDALSQYLNWVRARQMIKKPGIRTL
jgi:predicted phage terminase large subunit-like protein